MPPAGGRPQGRQHIGGAHARLQKQAQAGNRLVVPQSAVRLQVHQHVAAIAAVRPIHTRHRELVRSCRAPHSQDVARFQLQAPCERLGDEDRAAAERRPRPIGRSLHELNRAVVGLGKLHGIDGNRAALRFDDGDPAHAVARDSRCRQQRFHEAGIEPPLGPAGPRPGRGQIDVRAQGPLEPVMQRLAEALNHDRYPDHGGNRHPQRGHGYARPAQRRCDVPECQPGHRARATQAPGGGACEEAQYGRRERGDTEEQHEERGEPCKQAASRREHHDAGSHSECTAGDQQPSRDVYRPLLERRSPQAQLRRTADRFQGWQQRRRERSAHASKKGLHDRSDGQRCRVDCDDEIQIVDGPRDEADQAAAHGQPQADPQDRTDEAQEAGLDQHDLQHLRPRGAQHTQHSDDPATLHDRETDSAVDEQGAHEQREEAHGFQVRREGGGHVEVVAGPAVCLLQSHARRQPLAQLGENSRRVRAFSNAHVDSRQPTRQAHPFLRLGYVGQQQGVVSRSRLLQACDEDRSKPPAARIQRERLICREAELCGRPRRHHDGSGFREPATRVGILDLEGMRRALPRVEIRSREGLESDELQGALANRDIPFHDGRKHRRIGNTREAP